MTEAASPTTTTHRPSVTVAVISYGNFTGLEHTIASILAQKYPIHTIILSDDGSGIPFPPYVVSMLDRYPGQVIVRETPENLGTTAHINRTACLCHTDYLKVLASGDTLSDPEALQSLVAFAEQEKSLVVTSNAAIVSENLKYHYYTFPGKNRGDKLNAPIPVPNRTLMLSNIVSAVGSLFRMDFFREHGGFDETYRLLEDWPTWLRLTKDGYSIPYLDRVTCCHSLGGLSSGNGNAFLSPRLRTDMLQCYEKEILPYLNTLSPSEQRQVQHGYDSLSDRTSFHFWKKHLWLELKNRAKRGVKCALLIFCKRKNPWSVF